MVDVTITEEIIDVIEDNNYNNIALCCVGKKNKNLLNYMDLTNRNYDLYDFHPYLGIDKDYYQKDIIFDDVDFNRYDLVVHFSAEKTYPLGKIINNNLFLIYDTDHHNGNCTLYNDGIIDLLKSDNLIENTKVIGRSKNKFYCFSYKK